MRVSARVKERAREGEIVRIQSEAAPRGCNQTLKLSINTLSNLFFSAVSHFHKPFVA